MILYQSETQLKVSFVIFLRSMAIKLSVNFFRGSCKRSFDVKTSKFDKFVQAA